MVSWQSPRSIIQTEMSSLLTLDAIDRAIGDFLVVGLSIGERVHSFVNPPWGFVGWDSPRKAVVRLIREAKPLEIGGERAKRMKHALVVHAREGGCKFFATDMERVEAMERRLAE